MADKPKKFVTATTPVGTLLPWAKLVAPDEKYNKYGAKISMPADHPFVKKTIKMVNDQAKEALAEAIEGDKRKDADKKKKPIKASENCPYENETDDDGNETGNVILKFGLAPEGKKKNGEKYTRKPKLFNAVGQPLKLTSDPWGGSQVSIAFTFVKYGNPAIGAGCTLRLDAVQVVELKKGGQDAEGYGFAKHEGGFEETAEEDGEEPKKGTDDENAGGDDSSDDDDF